tara:strand:- start:433 stop:621 length:189 start_codon:yes stop_codon:yes gene_type:complete
MKQAATKIHPGYYSYKGYTIEEVGRANGETEARWNIGKIGEDAHDAANTMRDAKRWIDSWVI